MEVATEVDRSVMRMMMLPSGHAPSAEFFESVRRQVEEVIPAMQRGVSYTLEVLCGPEFWGPLTAAQRQLAGKCVAFMVTAGLLPLEFVGCKHANPKEYRLK